MRTGPKLKGDVKAVADGMYALSHRTSVYAKFISHSWSAHGLIKAGALLIYFNGEAAAYGGLVCGVCLAALRYISWLPAWQPNAQTDQLEILSLGAPTRIAYSSWGLIGYTIAYIISTV